MAGHDHTHHEDCRALLGSLSLYLDGEAEESLCREIERHIADCENCRVVVDTLARTVKLYRDNGHAHLSGDARRRLYIALDLSEYIGGEEQQGR